LAFEKIKKAAVAGSGTMGSGIAQLVAMTGLFLEF